MYQSRSATAKWLHKYCDMLEMWLQDEFNQTIIAFPDLNKYTFAKVHFQLAQVTRTAKEKKVLSLWVISILEILQLSLDCQHVRTFALSLYDLILSQRHPTNAASVQPQTSASTHQPLLTSSEGFIAPSVGNEIGTGGVGLQAPDLAGQMNNTEFAIPPTLLQQLIQHTTNSSHFYPPQVS